MKRLQIEYIFEFDVIWLEMYKKNHYLLLNKIFYNALKLGAFTTTFKNKEF